MVTCKMSEEHIRNIVKSMLNESRDGSKFSNDDNVREFSQIMASYSEDCLIALKDTVTNDEEWIAGLNSVKDWSESLRINHARALNLVHEGASELYEYSANAYAKSVGITPGRNASLGDFITCYVSQLGSVREIQNMEFFSSLGYADRSMLGYNTLRAALRKVVNSTANLTVPRAPTMIQTSPITRRDTDTARYAPSRSTVKSTAAKSTTSRSPIRSTHPITPDDSVSQAGAPASPSKRRRISKSKWEGASVFSDAASRVRMPDYKTSSSQAPFTQRRREKPVVEAEEEEDQVKAEDDVTTRDEVPHKEPSGIDDVYTAMF